MTKHEASKIIAFQIMGWVVCPKCGSPLSDEPSIGHALHCTKYSYGCTWKFNPVKDANEAVKVFEVAKLFQIRRWYGSDAVPPEWLADDKNLGIARASTFCLAICTAALRTLGIKEDIDNN